MKQLQNSGETTNYLFDFQSLSLHNMRNTKYYLRNYTWIRIHKIFYKIYDTGGNQLVPLHVHSKFKFLMLSKFLYGSQ
jgi:hypothetical protein